ncbi:MULTISPECIES: LPS export ABC transporter permease LptG [unclassified Xanthobacter]|uniref:LPS export ABC transporter permease LptG n=1 Tax=unclassified Xanthobacter TaxID=2623496 RepID=UPI001EE127A9|nr:MULTISPECIES: LPS export ABC transporter permease LptG [unclassified Xanthobacter]
MIGRTLGLYFARRFAAAVGLIFFACVGLIMLVDFLEMARRTADRENVSAAMVALVTLYRAPAFTEQLLPFAVLFGGIATFVLLSRRLELVVARAVGLSVWQFIAPPVLVAFLIGVFATTVFNPLSADFKERANQLESEIFGGSGTLLGPSKDDFWVRQQSVDGQAIIQAAASSQGGRQLSTVVVYEFDRHDRLMERVEARSATLGEGAWILRDARVLIPGQDLQHFDTYEIATNLDPSQVQDSLIAPETVPFWQLPSAIRSAEQAGFGATRYRLQLQSLLARPLLLVAMVLIAAVVGLRVFRFGGVGQTILGGVAAGFLLYVGTKLAEDLGDAGIVHPVAAAWFPAVAGIVMGAVILLYREDG